MTQNPFDKNRKTIWIVKKSAQGRKVRFDQFCFLSATMKSNRKLTIDLLLSVFSAFILVTTVLSLFTADWQHDENQMRIGIFHQCSKISSLCENKELSRTVTNLVVLSILLLLVSTVSTFFLMTTNVQDRNRCYLFLPLILLAAGLTMTTTLIHIMDLITINSYSAFIFIIDNVLTYVMAGITILHGCVFYFS